MANIDFGAFNNKVNDDARSSLGSYGSKADIMDARRNSIFKGVSASDGIKNQNVKDAIDFANVGSGIWGDGNGLYENTYLAANELADKANSNVPGGADSALRNISGALAGFNNWIGNGIDGYIVDNFGNLVGNFDKGAGDAIKNATTGEQLAAIPAIAEVLASSALAGPAGGMLMSAALSGDDLANAITGYDEFGQQLTDEQRAMSALTFGLDTALGGIGGGTSKAALSAVDRAAADAAKNQVARIGKKAGVSSIDDVLSAEGNLAKAQKASNRASNRSARLESKVDDAKNEYDEALKNAQSAYMPGSTLSDAEIAALGDTANAKFAAFDKLTSQAGRAATSKVEKEAALNAAEKANQNANRAKKLGYVEADSLASNGLAKNKAITADDITKSLEKKEEAYGDKLVGRVKGEGNAKSLNNDSAAETYAQKLKDGTLTRQDIADALDRGILNISGKGNMFKMGVEDAKLPSGFRGNVARIMKDSIPSLAIGSADYLANEMSNGVSFGDAVKNLMSPNGAVSAASMLAARGAAKPALKRMGLNNAATNRVANAAAIGGMGAAGNNYAGIANTNDNTSITDDEYAQILRAIYGG